MDDAFWKRFLKQTTQEGDCLIWTGPGFGPKGFGLYKDDKKLAHRAAYEHYKGEPARRNHRVLQTCGNKRCVAKAHLQEDSQPSIP